MVTAPKNKATNPSTKTEPIELDEAGNAPVVPGLAAEVYADPQYTPEDYETLKGAFAKGYNAATVIQGAFQNGVMGWSTSEDFATTVEEAMTRLDEAVAALQALANPEPPIQDMLFSTYHRTTRDKSKDKERPVVMPADPEPFEQTGPEEGTASMAEANTRGNATKPAADAANATAA